MIDAIAEIEALSLIKNIKFDKEVMLAGNIQIDDNLENFNNNNKVVDHTGVDLSNNSNTLSSSRR